MTVIAALGVLLAAAAAWTVFVLASPTTACTRCARRGPHCPRCKGTGRRFRRGARVTQALIVSFIAYRRAR